MQVAERKARPGRPLGLAPARFLGEFWQKRPLLVRAAFPAAAGLLDRRTLLATARRSEYSARVVARERPRGPLRLRHAPFARGELSPPADRPWTVLVNDLDKHHPDRLLGVLEAFRFLPAWRIDDVMASLATPGGSVGAHVDQYDVFLIQGVGRREWRLDLRTKGWRCDPRSELRLVRGFKATWKALLEPGDLLYLPPGVPHHGIAREECITLSLGMRAPALGDLFGAVADALLERDPTPLLQDPELSPRRDQGELSSADLRRIGAALAERLAGSEGFAEAIARFLSTWRGRTAPERFRPRFDPVAILAAGGRLRRNPWLRALWWRHGARARLAVGGLVFEASPYLAELIARPDGFGRAELPQPDPEETRLLRELAAHAALEVAPVSAAVR
jgi:50S ribosomal protein L16 3-hydroxylase